MSIRIVVGGVPNCGKSTFTASVYKDLQARGISVGIHELDVFANTLPCILGNVSWDKRSKVESGKWCDPRVSQAINEFEKDQSHFVLGDLTGIIDDLLKEMVKIADMAIAIGKDQVSLQSWLDFFSLQRIPIALKIISLLGKDAFPKVFSPDIIFIRNLKSEVLENDEIRQATDKLLSLCKNVG